MGTTLQNPEEFKHTLDEHFERNFKLCWDKLRNTVAPEQFQKVKQHLIHDISAKIYGWFFLQEFCPSINDIVQYTFHYHLSRVVSLPEKKRLLLQKSDEYKNLLKERVKVALRQELQGCTFRCLGSKYSPEIHTADHLCDLLLRIAAKLPREGLPAYDKERILLFQKSLCDAKAVLWGLQALPPSFCAGPWRTFFESRYKCISLTFRHPETESALKWFLKFAACKREEDADPDVMEELRDYAKAHNQNFESTNFRNYGWFLEIAPEIKTPCLKELVCAFDECGEGKNRNRYETYRELSEFAHTGPASFPGEGIDEKERDIYVKIVRDVAHGLFHISAFFLRCFKDSIKEEDKDQITLQCSLNTEAIADLPESNDGFS